MLPSDADVPVELPALVNETQTSPPPFEVYFSNFIESTEFSVEEAEAIVESGEVPAERPEDAHDVLGTFEAVHDAHLRSATPDSVEESSSCSVAATDSSWVVVPCSEAGVDDRVAPPRAPSCAASQGRTRCGPDHALGAAARYLREMQRAEINPYHDA